MYPRDSPLDLEAFSDSDYGGSNLDRKSTTGGCQFLGQRLISWQCKKQTIVATSTTEAEYVAAAHCCGQVLWVQNQLLDYGFNFMNTKIHIDNESTICIVKNPVYHSKTKHIEIRHHFIRDCYEKKLISVEKIHTDLNVADLLTKPFDGPRFNYLVVSIDLMKGKYEQLRNMMDIVPKLQSRVESLEKELSETKQTLGTAILQLTEKVKKLENKLRKKRKSKEAKGCRGEHDIFSSSLMLVKLMLGVALRLILVRQKNRVQRRNGKEPMTKRTFKLKLRSKTSKELQGKIGIEQEKKLHKKPLATEFDYIQARLMRSDSCRKASTRRKGRNILLKIEQSFCMTQWLKGKFLADQRSALIMKQATTISQLRGNQASEARSEFCSYGYRRRWTPRAIKKSDAEIVVHKEEEKKDDSVH
ncbi:hypothetical protein Tco_0413115 [Tanacetum coccineum]